ncbi:MAG: hypothetical protein E6J90_51010, partial [Deltaproteobacteria bacterium]
HRTLELVRDRRPELEIDGEMQPEIALDPVRRQQVYGFSRLTHAANTLVFGGLASGNAAYQIARAIGGCSAVGPILLGLSRPVAAMQNSVAFVGDTVFNIFPDAETLADITVQMADAVQGFGVTPRVAMISYSNFGSVRHPDVTRIHRTLELVRDRRPELEIDGEMQPEIALDPVRRQQVYGFSRLTHAANTLVFGGLASGNAAY